MKNTIPIALAVALLTMAAACHKDNKEAQLKALDNAYKSGVFTKEEYDAKRQALMGPPPAAPAPVAAAPAAAVPPATPPEPPPPETAVAPAPAPAPAPSAPPVAVQATPPHLPAPHSPAPRSAAPMPPRSSVVPPAPSAPQVPAAPPVSAPQVPTPQPPQAQPQPAPLPPAAEPAEPEPAPMAGCQDAESRAGGPNGVQERFFPVPEEAVRRAAEQAFNNLDFTIHRDSGHEMEASKRRHISVLIGAGGERLILHFAGVQQGGQRGTRVTGETKKSIVGRLAQRSWTSAVLAQIACNLRSGRH